MASSMLHVRPDDELKAKGTAALAAIGLSTADAVRILFHRIVADQAFPLELKAPNAPRGDGGGRRDPALGQAALCQCRRDVCEP